MNPDLERSPRRDQRCDRTDSATVQDPPPSAPERNQYEHQNQQRPCDVAENRQHTKRHAGERQDERS